MLSIFSFDCKSILTEWLVYLVEESLLEVLVLDELADSSKTLCDLVRWQTSHQVENGVSRSFLLLAMHGCLCHLYD